MNFFNVFYLPGPAPIPTHTQGGGFGFFQKTQIFQGPEAGNPSIPGSAFWRILNHANIPRQEEIPLNIAFGTGQLRILQQALVNLAQPAHPLTGLPAALAAPGEKSRTLQI